MLMDIYKRTPIIKPSDSCFAILFVMENQILAKIRIT